jgi:hypothetical protein
MAAAFGGKGRNGLIDAADLVQSTGSLINW